MSARSNVRQRRGFALLTALVMLVAVSLLALELGEVARARRLAAANALGRTAAAAAAEAGIEEAYARLADQLRQAYLTQIRAGTAAENAWAAAARLRLGPTPLGAQWYEVTARDVGTALNLNTVDGDGLRRFLRTFALSADRADRITQSLLDWRDADDLRRPNGAEGAEYLRLGAPLLPANTRLRSVAELRHVSGMSDDLYQRLLPYLTVDGSGRVNLNAAPAPVLLALPGMTDESVRLIMRWRNVGRRVAAIDALAPELMALSQQRLTDALPALRTRTTTETRELLVTSTAWSDDGATRVRAEALVVYDTELRVTWRRTSP
jgi:general secretion pathway protein K